MFFGGSLSAKTATSPITTSHTITSNATHIVVAGGNQYSISTDGISWTTYTLSNCANIYASIFYGSYLCFIITYNDGSGLKNYLVALNISDFTTEPVARTVTTGTDFTVANGELVLVSQAGSSNTSAYTYFIRTTNLTSFTTTTRTQVRGQSIDYNPTLNRFYVASQIYNYTGTKAIYDGSFNLITYAGSSINHRTEFVYAKCPLPVWGTNFSAYGLGAAYATTGVVEFNSLILTALGHYIGINNAGFLTNKKKLIVSSDLTDTVDNYKNRIIALDENDYSKPKVIAKDISNALPDASKKRATEFKNAVYMANNTNLIIVR